MADIVKLKKKAADLEAKKHLDKALDVYVEIVDAYEAGDEDTATREGEDAPRSAREAAGR